MGEISLEMKTLSLPITLELHATQNSFYTRLPDNHKKRT